LPDHQEFCFSHGASIGQTLRHTTNRRVYCTLKLCI
jgi:hypothetical protein